MGTIHHPPDTVRTELAHHLLRAASTGALTRRTHGAVRPLFVHQVEIPFGVTQFAASLLDTQGVWFWLPLWGGGEYACPTGFGHDLLRRWDAELFGEPR